MGRAATTPSIHLASTADPRSTTFFSRVIAKRSVMESTLTDVMRSLCNMDQVLHCASSIYVMLCAARVCSVHMDRHGDQEGLSELTAIGSRPQEAFEIRGCDGLAVEVSLRLRAPPFF